MVEVQHLKSLVLKANMVKFYIGITLIWLIIHSEARPSYVRCDGTFDRGNCANQRLDVCTSNVMNFPILDGNTVEPSFVETPPVSIDQGQQHVFNFESNRIRVAFASHGQFANDGSCTGVTSTRVAGTGGVEATLTWTAPLNYAGDVDFIFMKTTNAVKSQLTRFTETINVLAIPTASPTESPSRFPSVSPTQSPTAPTVSPTSSPTRSPSVSPTQAPTAPTVSPTFFPSISPSTETPTTPSSSAMGNQYLQFATILYSSILLFLTLA